MGHKRRDFFTTKHKYKMNLIKQLKAFRKARKAADLRLGILSKREIKALSDERNALLRSLENCPQMTSSITSRLVEIHESLDASDWFANQLRNLETISNEQ